MIFFALIFALIFAAGWVLAFFVLSRQRSRGGIARSLNMTLFSVRIPREFPKDGEKKQEKEIISVTEHLLSSFTALHAGGFKKFLYGEPYISLELAVHHIGEEINFYVAVPRGQEDVVEKQILGFYPAAEVSAAKDYNIFNSKGAAVGARFIFKRSQILPFRTYQKLEADPLSEILSAMSKLEEEGEGAAVQILIRPSHKTKFKKLASKVSEEIQQGRSFSEALGRVKGSKIVKEILSLVGSEKTKSSQAEKQIATPYHEEIVKSIVSKASKAAFDANIRIIASASSEIRARRILRDLESAFAQFASPDLNSLAAAEDKGRSLKKLIFDFSFRIFNDKQALYLSTEEIASLYHFPLPTTLASRVKMLKAKSVEPPPDLPKTGIVLGENAYRGQKKAVRMQKDDRRRHLYAVGQTGTGKSTFMKSMIIQDIEAGEGIGVIDPHGDLVEQVLSYIPKERAEDVILFNPADVARPLGMNILEIDPRRPEQKSFVIEDFYKILRMLYKDLPEAFGPIFEKFFRNAIMLLLDDYKNEVPTISEISRIFTDKAYRDLKLDRETNPEILRFWLEEAEKMSGEWSLPNMSGYITSKFNSFLINEYVRPIISQQKSAFDFREAMDNKKILLVSLPKGLIGDLNANLLGMIVVSKLLIAAFSRIDTPDEEKRRDFYLYIDEFQNFTTDSIASILSEARKYRLNLVIAHQFIKQLQENIRDAVFGNVGSMAVFRLGPDDAEFLKNRFEPVFSPQDLINIDSFNAYASLLINNQTSRPFNMRIIPPRPPEQTAANSIKELSRLKYGRDRGEVEKEFRERQRP